MQKLAQTLSVHGLRSIAAFPSLLYSCGCFLAFTVSLWGLIINIWNATTRFYEIPVSVSISVTDVGLEFPSVTVCNMNPYKKSLLEQWSTVQTFIAIYHQTALNTTNTNTVVNSQQSQSSQVSKAKLTHIFGVAVNGLRLWHEMNSLYTATETDCINSCLNTTKCAGTSSLRLDNVTLYCYLFNISYGCTSEPSWNSVFIGQSPPPGVCPNGTVPTTVVTTTAVVPFAITMINQSILFPYYSTMNDLAARSTVAQELLPYVLSHLDEHEISIIGYQIDEMLVACSFDGETCNGFAFGSLSTNRFRSNDFILNVDRSYGNCYTFNSTRFAAPTQKDRSGLKLLLNCEPEEYEDWILEGGMKLILHSANDTVFADTDGISVPPGFDSSFAFRKQTTEYFNRPQQPCRGPNTSNSEYFYPTDYSIEGCMRSLAQQYVISQCGCAYYKYGLPLGNISYCPTEKKTCVDNAVANFNGQSADQQLCPHGCTLVQYRPTVTMKRIIDKSWAIMNTRRSELSVATILSAFYFCPSFSSSLVSMEVYYETGTSFTYAESPCYQLKDLISDVGSQMGIWLGMSVMSIVEIIQMIGKALYMIQTMFCKS